MDRLIYTALSGLQASMQQQRVTANNMANAQTIGFRAELMDQRAVTTTGGALEVRAAQRAAVRSANMAPGEVVTTGQPLDIAVEGDALIAVQAADGSEGYTRRGDLSVTEAGLLVNGDGALVLGTGGPITVPPGSKLVIAGDGSLSASDPADPAAPALLLDRIKLASPAGSRIAKGLDGLFRVEGGGILPADPTATCKSGCLEQSNVKPTEVLVQMIDHQRLFELRSKLVGTARDLDESAASLMRL